MNAESLRHIQIALERLEQRVRAAAARAQAESPGPADALRGLIITPGEIEAHLAREPLAGLWPAGALADNLVNVSAGAVQPDSPLVHLQCVFSLTALDIDILLLALMPELDRRYERIFGYLHDNVTQRRPTVNLAMNLLGEGVPARFAVWARLAAGMPLRAHHLVNVLPDPDQREPVFLAHQLKADHRIVAYLLGDMTPDARLKGAVFVETPPAEDAASTGPFTLLDGQLAGPPLVMVHGLQGEEKRALAAGWCARHELSLVVVNVPRLRGLDMSFDLAWRLALREAQLQDAAVLLDGWAHTFDDAMLPPPELWSALLEYAHPVFLCDAKSWEPRDTARARRLLRIELGIPGYAERLRRWQDQAAALGLNLPLPWLEEVAAKFRLVPGQIARAVLTAADLAASRDTPLQLADLYTGAQTHASAELGSLAKKITPRFGWEDLILPPDRIEQLRELCGRARHEHIVHDAWGFGRKVAPGRGISALFAGESGTGKTMAAGVIAHELGLALYKIDLSSVVSKYIGETEKNLSVIFTEAHASNAILFFDEADALFGKRSEVKDAHDRYANIEIAYLLQQIEDYDGIAILATNLRQNLDEAFTRRLDFVIDFPFPDTDDRARIWAAHFPQEAPLAPEVDLAALAARYRLAGGNIRNAALASAYLAAADGGVITMAHLRRAVRREHQKIGRLLDDDDPGFSSMS